MYRGSSVLLIPRSPTVFSPEAQYVLCAPRTGDTGGFRQLGADDGPGEEAPGDLGRGHVHTRVGGGDDERDVRGFRQVHGGGQVTGARTVACVDVERRGQPALAGRGFR